MVKLAFTIDGPPVPKQSARAGTSGRFYIPSKSRNYMRTVSHSAHSAWKRAKEWNGAASNYRMTCRVYFPNRRRRDADNVIKAVQDGITKASVVWPDDDRVCELHVYRDYDKDNPRVEVEIGVAA